MTRFALLLLASGCGATVKPVLPAELKPSPPAFACPSALPTVRGDVKAAEALAGQSVDHVCIFGGSGETIDAATAALATKAAASLDPARIHDDLLALLDLPMVEDASAYASRSPSGLVVYFALTERPFIGELTFEGVHAFSHDELLKIPLAEGQRFDVRAVRSFAQVFRKAYEDRAYGGAKVDYKATLAEPGRMQVVITVDEGIRWKFGALAFAGQKTLSKTDLTKAIGFASGDTWNADVLERARLLVQALAYDRGLVQSDVKVAHGDPGPDGAVPVTFTLKEGDVFRIRKLSVANVTPAVEKQLLAAMKAKPRVVFSRSMLIDDMGAIKTKLGKDVEPNMTVDAPKKMVDIELQVAKP